MNTLKSDRIKDLISSMNDDSFDLLNTVADCVYLEYSNKYVLLHDGFRLAEKSIESKLSIYEIDLFQGGVEDREGIYYFIGSEQDIIDRINKLINEAADE